LKVKDNKLEMAIVRRGASGVASTSSPAPVVQALPPAPVKNGVKPHCKFVNVQLCGMSSHEGREGSNQATVLLENPQGQFALSPDSLKEQVSN
jgi:hypothetical protein